MPTLAAIPYPAIAPIGRYIEALRQIRLQDFKYNALASRRGGLP